MFNILKYIIQLTSFDIAESIKLAAGLACVVYSISPAYPQTHKFISNKTLSSSWGNSIFYKNEPH